MTLFDAIRQLKEGQAIVDMRGDRIFEWQPDLNARMLTPIYNDLFECHIIDLPLPKRSLEEGLTKAAHKLGLEIDCSCCPEREQCPSDNTDCQTIAGKMLLAELRKLNIDWEAEVNRQ